MNAAIMLKPDDSTGDFSSSDGTVSQDRISNPNFLFEVELAPATEGILSPLFLHSLFRTRNVSS